MDVSDITATELQDEIIAPINIDDYREQEKRTKDDEYTRILAS